MTSILGFSTDKDSDDLVAQRVVALAQERGATSVVMVTHGGMDTTMGHGLGLELLPGESDHDASLRAVAMCDTAKAAGLEATPQASSGPEGSCMTAVCETFSPTSIVVGTPKHRLVGNLLDTESVRAAKHHCDDVEALHS
jgi:hypothetical protein